MTGSLQWFLPSVARRVRFGLYPLDDVICGHKQFELSARQAQGNGWTQNILKPDS